MKSTLVCLFLVFLSLTPCRDFGPRVIAFRGARSVMPDNSHAGFKSALTIGSDALWVEVQTSKDGVLVVHDQPLIDHEKCLRPDGTPMAPNARPAIHDLELTQIKAFDCGSLGHPLYGNREIIPGATIPTLAEVIDIFKSATTAWDNGETLMIELKYDPGCPHLFAPPSQLAWSFYEAVVTAGILTRVEVASTSMEVLSALRLLDPKLFLIAVMESPSPSIRTLLRGAKPDAIAPRMDFLSPKDMTLLSREGVRVYPWLVNSHSHWDALVELGVDGIITDLPEELVIFLENRDVRPLRMPLEGLSP